MRVHRFAHRFGQRLSFLWTDNNQIHAGADKLLHMRALFERVILGIFENNLQLGLLICCRFDLPFCRRRWWTGWPVRIYYTQ